MRRHPVQMAAIVVVTVGGLAVAVVLALVGLLLALPEYWDGTPKPFGDRMTGVMYIVLAGIAAAAGPLLAGELRRSLAATIVGCIIVGLGVTAAATAGIVFA